MSERWWVLEVGPQRKVSHADRMFRLLTIPIVLAALLGQSTPQQPAPPPTFKVEVSYVEIDARVNVPRRIGACQASLRDS